MARPQHTSAPDTSPDPAGARAGAWRSFAIFVAAFLLFALLPSRNTNYADDSLSWAFRVSQTQWLISIHHLFLNAMRVFYHTVLPAFGLNLEPARMLTIYCALFGAVGLAYLDALLRLAGLGRLALPGTLVCAFTSGYWAYSIIGDVYVPATACLVAAVYWFGRGLRPGASMLRCGALATLALFLMVMHHQAYFMFAGGLLPGVLLMRGTNPRRLAYALLVVVVAGAAIFATYFAVYRNIGSRESLRVFLSGYASQSGWRPDQMQVSPATVVRAAAGGVRAVVSTNLLFRSPAATLAVQRQFPYRNIYPYPYLVRNVPPPLAALIVVVLALALLAGGALALRGLWRGLRQRELLALVFGAAVFQALFFMWWEAISDEFWIWTTPIFACALAAGAAGFGRRDRALVGLIAGALGISTYVGSIALFADPANDIDAVNVGFLTRVGPRDLVVGFDEIQNNFRSMIARDRQGFHYYDVLNHATTWSDADERELDSLVAVTVAGRGRVFVGPYVVDPPRSNLAFVRLANPDFDRQRAAIVARLARVDSASVVWVSPRATVPGYFAGPPQGVRVTASGIVLP